MPKFLDAHLQVRDTSTDGASQLLKIQARLRDVSRRLDVNRDLLSDAIRQSTWKTHQWCSGSYLVSSKLSNADLSNLDFFGSFMVGAWFDQSTLSHCSFIDADLRGASFWHCTLNDSWFTRARLDLAGFDNADLTNSKLAEAKITSVEKLGSANWWKADFYLPAQEGVDVGLLEKLFANFGESVPSDSSQLHKSVREFRQRNTTTPTNA